MLSRKEKKEILHDARSSKRREDFRITQSAEPLPTFDDYLRFLSQVQNAFTKAADQAHNSPHSGFKL